MNSPRLLARFREGARDHLARADALLMRLGSDPRAVGARSELLRILHTVKAESRAMGLGEAADHAHRAEGELLAWTGEPPVGDAGALKVGDAGALKEVGRALAAIEALVEARVGALRLHSSGARALPAREALPLLDLGDGPDAALPANEGREVVLATHSVRAQDADAGDDDPFVGHDLVRV